MDYTFAQLRKACKSDASSLPSLRLAVVGDCSTQHLCTAIKGRAYCDGIGLEVFDADYNQLEAQLMDAQSELYLFRPDAVLIYMCSEKLYEAFCETPPEGRADFAQLTFDKIQMYWSSIAQNSTANILQFDFVALNDACFGSYALKTPEAFRYQLKKLNYLLSEGAHAQKNAYLVDLDDIQSFYGRGRSFDEKFYYIAKLPLSIEILPQVAKSVAAVAAALMGRVKKCVVLDLDNTLWGGVIGDDGLSGIQIGELGDGHAFTDFQRWLKELKNRGVLLAVCSKNNEDAAKEPFEKHPDMILRLDDFSAFVANWEDKASNIKRIQSTLNIGMDSIVFIDDNPFERELVKSLIPEATVPDLPADPALYLQYLQRLNLFETASFSIDDAKRTSQYREEAQRSSLLADYGSYDDYLIGLEMTATAAPFDEFHYPRIAQLTQRSNQFNLRTVRYTEAQIEEAAQDERLITRYYMLKDRFGDYGLISVVIMDKQPNDTLFIGTWLMSCRVLKRGMEEFIVNDIMKTARENGFSRVVGEYIKTPKNAMVENIYARLGFTQDGNRFTAQTDGFTENKTYIMEEK